MRPKRDPRTDPASDYDGPLHWAECYMLVVGDKPTAEQFVERGWSLNDRQVRYVLDGTFGCEVYASEGGVRKEPFLHPGRILRQPAYDYTSRATLGMCNGVPRCQLIEDDRGFYFGWIGGGVPVPGDPDYLAQGPSEWEEGCMQYRGVLLRGKHGHWCEEWDGLPVDENCDEWGKDPAHCICGFPSDEEKIDAKTDDQLIAEHRQKKIARLEAAIEEARDTKYVVVPCPCGGDPVRRPTAKYCGHCGSRLPREEAS